MSQRRLVQIFVLVALLLAPIGRIGVAQAMHGAPMASHCADQPVPDQGKPGKAALDCMIACAAMAAGAAPFVLPAPAPEAMVLAAPACRLSGIRPEADPPPPRFA